MITLSQISVRVNDIRSFRGLLEVYEDLAAQKMQKVRSEISQFRDYTKTLTMISGDLEEDISSVIKKNSKRAATVLITSDKGLYGNAFEVLGRRFFDELTQRKYDAYVVGSIGEEVVKKCDGQIKYSLVKTDKDSLTELWKKLSEYQEITIYYLRFDSLAKQSVDTVHISGDLLPIGNEGYEYNEKNKLKYLYEPSVAEVADLFAKEVLSFLAEQTMKEADLAKYAARLMYLDTCLERNNEHLTGTLRQKLILTKRLSNKRQNARLASYLTIKAINNYA